MGSRAATAEIDEEPGVFRKDGTSIKFCFHPSVRQGRGRLTEEIERNGGRVVEDERETHVLLVDEEENITLIRRRYYSSSDLYRRSIFVETRQFVRHCILTGYYAHLGPPWQGMPGPIPGGNRPRVAFTSEDRQHLAYYLSTIFPTRDGRLGMIAYKELEQLGQNKENEEYAWARRHTAHSWREHYKKNREEMDRFIEFYARRMEGRGHQLGQDRRTRNLQDLRQEEEEEEEEEEEGRQPQDQRHREGEERRREPRQPVQADAAAAARNYLAQHEQNLVAFEDEEEEAPQEGDVAVQEPQRIKRRHPDAQALQAKRVRVAEVSSRQKDGAPAVERGRGEGQEREESVAEPESQPIEGSDLFGDREYEDGPAHDFRNMPDLDLPRPVSPEVVLVDGNDGPPATQATLVASPGAAEKHAPPRSRAAAAPAPAPPSSQVTLVTTQERVVQRVRGTSAQPGPSHPRIPVAQATLAASKDGPYRNTRARSRSVEPQPPPAQRRKGKGKTKDNELVAIPERAQAEDNIQTTEQAAQAVSSTTNNGLSTRDTLEDEMAVEDLLKASARASDGNPIGIDDEDDDDESDGFPPLPPYQDIEVLEISDVPSDSDDVETDHALELAAKNGSRSPHDGEDAVSDSESEEEDIGDRINQMANRSLTQLVPPSTSNLAPRTTRSMAQLAAHRSPRKPSSNGNQTLTQGSPFPTPGTKARAVVDRANEAERNLPYAPPPGSRAERALRRRG